MSNGDGESVRKSTGVRSEGGKGSESQQTQYGLFNRAWECRRLSEICLKKNGVQTGPFGSQLHKKDYVRNGTPIITVEHLGENRILHNNIPMVSNEDRDRLNKYKIKKGDILFSRVGSVDRRSIVRQEEDGWLFSGRCLRVRPQHSLIDPEYLSYFFGLSEFKDYIRRIAVGATMPSLNTKLLSDVPIYHPPLPEQRAIAHILGTLDDKIELNCRMNETLEAMARAIFKSWFVDYDPVRAKAEGRPTGLPDELAALFPDSFEESELGEIPEGWEVKTVGEVVEFAYGKALKVSNRKPGKVPVFGSNGQVGLHNEALVKGPGIIIGRKGNPGIVTWSYEDFFPIDTTFYVKKTGIVSSLNYLFYALKTQGLPSLSADSAVPGLNRNLAYMSKFLVPNEKVLMAFDGQIDPIFQMIYANEKEINTLASFRDTLLPKLISGELRITDAEMIMEAVI